MLGCVATAADDPLTAPPTSSLRFLSMAVDGGRIQTRMQKLRAPAGEAAQAATPCSALRKELPGSAHKVQGGRTASSLFILPRNLHCTDPVVSSTHSPSTTCPETRGGQERKRLWYLSNRTDRRGRCDILIALRGRAAEAAHFEIQHHKHGNSGLEWPTARKSPMTLSNFPKQRSRQPRAAAAADVSRRFGCRRLLTGSELRHRC